MAHLPDIQAVYVHTGDRVTGARRVRAFSLVDVLVSMAVVAVLMSLLLPSLQRVRESAFRVKCKASLAHVGIAMNVYADDFFEHLPPAALENEEQDEPVRRLSEVPFAQEDGFAGSVIDTMNAMGSIPVTVDSRSSGSETSTVRYGWQGLGLLYSEEYVSTPEACYCPSHHGHHPYERYKSHWMRRDGAIVTNYQYRVPGHSSIRFELPPRTTIVTDGMETKLDYNHIKGSNTLRVDGSVGWFEDFDSSLYNSLPDEIEVEQKKEGTKRNPIPAWEKLDNASASRSGRHRPRGW